MESGSLAEWITGISELLAVCVALFLPYINEKKQKKRTSIKINSISYNMAIRVIQEKRESFGISIEDLDSYKIFEKYTQITLLLIEDFSTIENISTIQNYLISIDENNNNIDYIYEKIIGIKSRDKI